MLLSRETSLVEWSIQLYMDFICVYQGHSAEAFSSLLSVLATTDPSCVTTARAITEN